MRGPGGFSVPSGGVRLCAIVCRCCPSGLRAGGGSGGHVGWFGFPCAWLKRGMPHRSPAPPLPKEELWLLPGCCPGAGSSPRPGPGSPSAGEARLGAPSRPTWAEAHSPHTPREGAAPLWVGAARPNPRAGALLTCMPFLPAHRGAPPPPSARLVGPCLRARVLRAPGAGWWVGRRGSPGCCLPPCSTSPSRQTVL